MWQIHLNKSSYLFFTKSEEETFFAESPVFYPAKSGKLSCLASKISVTHINFIVMLMINSNWCLVAVPSVLCTVIGIKAFKEYAMRPVLISSRCNFASIHNFKEIKIVCIFNIHFASLYVASILPFSFSLHTMVYPITQHLRLDKIRFSYIVIVKDTNTETIMCCSASNQKCKTQ